MTREQIIKILTDAVKRVKREEYWRNREMEEKTLQKTLQKMMQEAASLQVSDWGKDFGGPACLHDAMDKASPEYRFQTRAVSCPCRKCSAWC